MLGSIAVILVRVGVMGSMKEAGLKCLCPPHSFLKLSHGTALTASQLMSTLDLSESLGIM